MDNHREEEVAAVRQRLTFDTNDELLEYDRNASPNSVKRCNSKMKQTHETPISFWIAFCIFILCLLIILLSFVPSENWKSIGLSLTQKEDALYITWQDTKHISLLGFLFGLVVALGTAVGCLIFSWKITYLDSLAPGKVPPSPTSPRKIREASGHTFHLNYTLCVVNSVAVFVYVLYWMKDSYL